jgi:hypothetical protein
VRRSDTRRCFGITIAGADASACPGRRWTYQEFNEYPPSASLHPDDSLASLDTSRTVRATRTFVALWKSGPSGPRFRRSPRRPLGPVAPLGLSPTSCGPATWRLKPHSSTGLSRSHTSQVRFRCRCGPVELARPVGTLDRSPAFQRRVDWQNDFRPVGTTEMTPRMLRSVSGVPTARASHSQPTCH